MTTIRTAIAAARTIASPRPSASKDGAIRRDVANGDTPCEREARGGKQETRRGASDRWGGKQIWTKEIRSIASASDGYGTSGTKVADLTDDSWKVDRRTCKRSSIKGRHYATVDGHYASVWDGKPRMYDYMD